MNKKAEAKRLNIGAGHIKSVIAKEGFAAIEDLVEAFRLINVFFAIPPAPTPRPVGEAVLARYGFGYRAKA